MNVFSFAAALRLFLAALLLSTGQAMAAPFDIAQLMRMLGEVRTGEATFVEKRQVRELDQVLESSGRLSFSAPDVFVRETLKPRSEKIAVDGNTVTMSRGSRTRTVQLDAVPEAQVIVEAIRGTLTGNREVLERHFTLQLGGSPGSWALDLTPRDARLRMQVSSIRVTGRNAVLDEVDIDLPGGDRSEMTIKPVASAAK
jgi:outer membrane lipoprotein-sorting protein